MRCWSCHKAEMIETGDKVGHPYRKCPECGATDTDLPKLRAPALVTEHDYGTGRTKYKPGPGAIYKGKKK